jgi:proteasome accessory factor B
LRQIEELLYLNGEGLRAVELAQELEVDRRTIYRDLDFLCDQGIPIWQENGYFGINRTRYLSTLHLTYHEAIALLLAGLLLSRSIDEHNPHVAAALRKLAMTLPRPLTAHLKRAAERVQAHSAGQRHVAVLEALAEGWGSGRKVRVDYRSPRSGALRRRVLAPYALEPTASGIYVIGHDDWAGDIRTFKLDRLENASVLAEPFCMPEDFDLEAFLESGWRIMAGEETQEVMLRFTAAVAAHVAERHWHPSQTLDALPDGGCMLSVHVAEPQEMQPWIRSWGAQVEVLAPAWLRKQIAAELAQAAAIYDTHEEPQPSLEPDEGP